MYLSTQRQEDYKFEVNLVYICLRGGSHMTGDVHELQACGCETRGRMDKGREQRLHDKF